MGNCGAFFSSVQILSLLLKCVYLVQLPNFNGIVFLAFFPFSLFIDSGLVLLYKKLVNILAYPVSYLFTFVSFEMQKLSFM